MGGPTGLAGLRDAVVSPRRDGRVRAIPIIQKLMLHVYLPAAHLVQAGLEYLVPLGQKYLV